MMDARAAALLLLVVATPAQACHRYHVWRYPTPQRCSISTHGNGRDMLARLARPPDRPQRVLSTEPQVDAAPMGWGISELQKAIGK